MALPNPIADSQLVQAIASRLAAVRGRMRAAALRADRDPNEIRLVVVTKLHPASTVAAAITAGAELLGENYPEEAEAKIAELIAAGGVAPREWHMIGHVQSRKAGIVASHFSLAHSVDSLKLARRLDAAAAARGQGLAILLEFNVGGEASKHGWVVPQKNDWGRLLPEVEAIMRLPNLHVRGLMTMPPLGGSEAATRMCFSTLRALRDFMQAGMSGAKLPELSMGTSPDFELAIEEGATLVRVGEAILGPRRKVGSL